MKGCVLGELIPGGDVIHSVQVSRCKQKQSPSLKHAKILSSRVNHFLCSGRNCTGQNDQCWRNKQTSKYHHLGLLSRLVWSLQVTCWILSQFHHRFLTLHVPSDIQPVGRSRTGLGYPVEHWEVRPSSFHRPFSQFSVTIRFHGSPSSVPYACMERSGVEFIARQSTLFSLTADPASILNGMCTWDFFLKWAQTRFFSCKRARPWAKRK